MKLLPFVGLIMALLHMSPLAVAQGIIRYKEYDVRDEFSDEIPPGRLMHRWFEAGGIDAIFLYKSNLGSELILSGDLRNLNIFLAEQVKAGTEADFVLKKMEKVVRFMVATNTVSLIVGNSWHVSSYKAMKRDDAVARWSTLSKDYEPPTISGMEWKMAMYVLTHHGNVERWKVGGTVAPLGIVRFEREVVAGPAFPEIPMTR